MTDDRIALLERIYAEWGAGDYTSARDLDPQFELVYGSDFLEGGTFTGLAAASEGWRGWLAQWSSWKSRSTEHIPVGDRVLTLIEVSGVGRSTGLQLAQQSANLWEFRDGRASRLVLYTHAETAVRELGLDPP